MDWNNSLNFEERDNEDLTEDHMERVLMAEFSNCLQSIIQSATDSAAAAKIAKVGYPFLCLNWSC